MKVQLETITSQTDSSFSTMYNPRLSDLFFWHFHPEYELVYIVGANGSRHVGNHISTYEHSDLVLIGSNIPHLNFDYGVKTEYQKAVVHLKQDFVESHFSGVPELSSIHDLFQKAQYGLAFTGKFKDTIGEALFALARLSPIEQYVKLIELLHALSQAKEIQQLHKQPYRQKLRSKEQARMQSIHAFIDRNYHRKISLDEIADHCHMTKEAFCRYFKSKTSYPFIEFLNRYRISHSKRYLLADENISTACFKSGFESLSYYNRVFKKITGENPSTFKKRHR